MTRHLLALAAGALAATATLPATAHAGGNFRVFTSRAAYLAAVQASGGTSRPQIVSGASATTFTPQDGRVGNVEYSTTSVGATITPRTTGGVLDVQAGTGAGGTFRFAGTEPPEFFGTFFGRTFGLGLSYTALTDGAFTFGVDNFLPFQTPQTFALQAGGSGFFGYLFDVDATRLLTDITLDAPAGAGLTVTGIDVADGPSSTVPEPASVALMGAGLAGVGLAVRRRARA